MLNGIVIGQCWTLVEDFLTGAPPVKCVIGLRDVDIVGHAVGVVEVVYLASTRATDKPSYLNPTLHSPSSTFEKCLRDGVEKPREGWKTRSRRLAGSNLPIADMNCLFVAACAALLCLGAASDVIELGDSNFDTEIARHEIALAEFYAPWCGHCKRLAPEYEKAATKLKTNDPPISLIKVDCTVEKATCDKFGVSGFPTLKIFRNGEMSSDYEGPREADGIVKFLRGQAGPSAKDLTSVADFDKFINNEDISVIGFFEGESKLKDSFLKVADTERDRFRFAYSSNPEVLKKVGYTDDIVVYQPKQLKNKFDPEEFKYDGNYDTDKIKHFLVEETTGLAGIRTNGNSFQFTKRPLVVVYYNVDYVKDPKGSQYWRNRVLKVAQEYKRKYFFAVSNKEEFATEIEQFGLSDRKDSDKPLVGAFTADGKFALNKEFSVDNLKQFVEDLIAGKLEPFLKSEPIPTEQGDLKTVVAKNYKELVADADKDILLEFYAPWCGHCKSLAPKLEELATKLAKEDVVIAKFDATANDVPPQYNVRGFPTLYWIPKNAKSEPIAYNGGREVKDFIKYIAAHATDGLKGYTKDGKKKKSEL
uniref:Protein disulfide-isomerase n=1 Tax=Panagrellus redivivus TaxID=6233 RepID=A0A7E4V5V0_PANRE